MTDFLRNFSWQFYFLFTLRVFARNLLRGNRRRNSFRILVWCLAWASNPGFTSNKPTHYLLNYGDFSLLLAPVLIFFMNVRTYSLNVDIYSAFAKKSLREEVAERNIFFFGFPKLRKSCLMGVNTLFTRLRWLQFTEYTFSLPTALLKSSCSLL